MTTPDIARVQGKPTRGKPTAGVESWVLSYRWDRNEEAPAAIGQLTDAFLDERSLLMQCDGIERAVKVSAMNSAVDDSGSHAEFIFVDARNA